MPVLPGVGAAFEAGLQDNGNPIPLPDGSSFAWATDDPSDDIKVADDTLTAVVTVAADTTRKQVTITASTVAPDGQTYSGSLTTDILPGNIPHVYTVTVNQFLVQPVGRKKK